MATGYTGTVHFTSSDSQAMLPANYTIHPRGAGTFSFSATLKTAGNQSITATDTTTASITGSQSNIVVQAAALKALAVTGFPSSVTAGSAAELHGQRRRPVWKRDQRLHRHGAVLEQRPAGRSAGQLHFCHDR